MQITLTAISFVCAVLLALFIPIPRVRCNMANLAVIVWLIGANLVHGINAIIWAGNVELRVPVWCDIVTKLLVGATVALPGAMASMALRLELVSSTRSISNEPKSQTVRIMVDFLLCYIIPIGYMGLHFIVQDHRFDLSEDYGCSASIHPSAVGLILMWLPPIILCALSFVLCGASISHLFSMSASSFSVHLDQRSPYTSSYFIRRLAITTITTSIIFVVSLFSVFTVSGFLPWTTWSAAHAQFDEINIVQSAEEIRNIKLVWWGVPAVSLGYVALVLAMGEETRDAFKWIRKSVGHMRMPQWRPGPLILLPLYSTQSRSDFESRSQLTGTPLPKPESLELKSGWDDMLEDKKAKKPKLWSSPKRKTPTPTLTSIRTSSPSPTSVRTRNSTASPLPSRTSTPTPSATSPTVCGSGEDEAFLKSTLDYLGSPVAKTLGISPPSPPKTTIVIPPFPRSLSPPTLVSPLIPTPIISSPAPAYVSPTKTKSNHIVQVHSPTTPSSVRSVHDMPPSPPHVPTDVDSGSVISSVFDAAWPQPPPSSPKLSSRYHATGVGRPQPSLSVVTDSQPALSFGSPLLPSITPPHRRHSRPFVGSSISSIDSSITVMAQARQKRAPSVKSLMRTFSSEKIHGDAKAGTPVIYMHVVNEVAHA